MSHYALSTSDREFPSTQKCVVIDEGIAAQFPSTSYGQWFAKFDGTNKFNLFSGNQWNERDSQSLGTVLTLSTDTLADANQGDQVLAPLSVGNGDIWTVATVLGTP